MDFSINCISENVIECCIADAISHETTQRILSIYNTIKHRKDITALGIVDIIPTYTSIAFHFKSTINLETVKVLVQGACSEPLTCKGGKHHVIEVAYNGEDLDAISALLGIAPQELIDLHASSSYVIAMQGFRSYFPYLLGLPSQLQLARRDVPRPKVRQGAIAIAGLQCGIYTEASPGGWHIIGYTDFRDFKRFEPGDQVTFRSISC